MQPLQQQNWLLPEEVTTGAFHAALADAWRVKNGPVSRTGRSWFDTFDWRLYARELLLCRQGTTWMLQDFTGRELHRLTTGRKVPRFSWEFPESPLRDALHEPLDVRALMAIGREHLEITEIRILNQDKKIVVFLDLCHSTLEGDGSEQLMVRVREVRGYAKKFRQLAGFLRGLGARIQDGPAATLARVAAAAGRQPLDYSSGYHVPLDAEMSGREAVRRIYLSLLEAMVRNEAGVIADIDSEFLHDLRVAVRRTRSGLALIRGVLAPEVVQRFKKDFRLIGSMTGPVRDLDVYLLSEQEYRARLPERLQEGLGYFFADLAARRRRERKKLVRFLKSSGYRRILEEWRALLETDDQAVWGNRAETPVGVLADRIVRKRFRRVLKDGSRIDAGSPDEELHRLRIECKKLRYSLEFFAPLHDRQRMKLLIGQLKKLQNNLGDFNDLSVQQEMMAGYLTGLEPMERKNLECAASLGGLMTDLTRRHRQVRAGFEKSFARFSRRENCALYHELFGKVLREKN